jgi:hypothetical protein
MNIEDRIILPKIKLIEETEHGYRVNYDNREVYIEKADRSSFSLNGSSGNQRMGLELSLIPEAKITQDFEATREFLLAMMFHELREKEYTEAEMSNPHERALNDEVLFVLKNLNPSERKKYFAFADEYRTRKLEDLKKRKRAEERIKTKEKLQERIKDNSGIREGDFNFYQGVRLVGSEGGDRIRVFICTNEETAERINELTKERKGLKRNSSVHYEGGVLPPEDFYKQLNYLKEAFSDLSDYKSPRLITGSEELNRYLIEKGVTESRLYKPLEDPKPFNKLKEIVGE